MQEDRTGVLAGVGRSVLYLLITSGRWGIADLDVFGLWANRY